MPLYIFSVIISIDGLLKFCHRIGEENCDGIAALKMQLDRRSFANTSESPGHSSCYNNNNLPTGVQNLTQCKLKVPIFLSRPHFYLADGYYAHQFAGQGIRPNPKLHESEVLIEPVSSIPLKVEMK